MCSSYIFVMCYHKLPMCSAYVPRVFCISQYISHTFPIWSADTSRTCSACVQYLFLMCSAHVPYMFPICSVHIHHLFSHVPCMSSTCFPYVQYIFPAFFLNVPHIFSTCIACHPPICAAHFCLMCSLCFPCVSHVLLVCSPCVQHMCPMCSAQIPHVVPEYPPLFGHAGARRIEIPLQRNLHKLH